MKKILKIILALIVFSFGLAFYTLLTDDELGKGKNEDSAQADQTREEKIFYETIVKAKDTEAEIASNKGWVSITYVSQESALNEEHIIRIGISDFVNLGKKLFEDPSVEHITVFMKYPVNDGTNHSATSFDAYRDEFNSINWDELKNKVGIYQIMQEKLDRCYVNYDLEKYADMTQLYYN